MNNSTSYRAVTQIEIAQRAGSDAHGNQGWGWGWSADLPNGLQISDLQIYPTRQMARAVAMRAVELNEA